MIQFIFLFDKIAAFNPEGIASISPGLARTSLPWVAFAKFRQP